MKFSSISNFANKIIDKTRYGRYKQAKAVVNSIVGENKTAKSIISTLDLGRYTAFVNPLKKNIKLYDVVSKAQEGSGELITDYVTCYFNNSKELDKIVMVNARDKAISVYDKLGKNLIKYTPEESIALFSYKSNSSNIHKVLRYNSVLKNNQTLAAVKKHIEILSNLFKANKNFYEATEDMITYRALDHNSLKKIMSMSKDGMVFQDPSFVSVATKLRSVLQFLNFHNCNHIMRIKIPKGTKFINLDEICHSIVMQPAENERLLDKGSKFLIKAKKGKHNMIEAEYLPDVKQM